MMPYNSARHTREILFGDTRPLSETSRVLNIEEPRQRFNFLISALFPRRKIDPAERIKRGRIPPVFRETMQSQPPVLAEF